MTETFLAIQELFDWPSYRVLSDFSALKENGVILFEFEVCSKQGVELVDFPLQIFLRLSNGDGCEKERKRINRIYLDF